MGTASRIRAGLLAIALVLAVATPSGAGNAYPDEIPLPSGFYPEGIALGRGHHFYVGSLLDGAIYRGSLRSGEGAVLAPGAEGRTVAGLAFDERSGLVWGVGFEGTVGTAFGFDGRTGELVHQVPTGGAFLNDLAIGRDALYITDSLSDVLWRVPLTRRGSPDGPAEPLPLTGDFTFVTEGELPINLNGIALTRDGDWLLAVHSTLGVLYRIDPDTGEATTVDLGGAAVPNGDGIVLHGRRLSVIQNFLEQVSVIRLSPHLRSGDVVDVITSDAFRIPTTGVRFRDSLYVVNARFDEAPPPLLGGAVQDLDYEVVRVELDD